MTTFYFQERTPLRKNATNINTSDAEKNLSVQVGVNTSETTGKSTATQSKRKKRAENDYYKVICPFFHDLSGHNIRCEGVIPDTKISTSFGNIRAMKRYRRKFCNTFGYEKCELCKVLQSKYDQ